MVAVAERVIPRDGRGPLACLPDLVERALSARRIGFVPLPEPVEFGSFRVSADYVETLVRWDRFEAAGRRARIEHALASTTGSFYRLTREPESEHGDPRGLKEVVSLCPIFRAKILTKSDCSRRASARQAVRIFPNCGTGCAVVHDDETT